MTFELTVLITMSCRLHIVEVIVVRTPKFVTKSVYTVCDTKTRCNVSRKLRVTGNQGLYVFGTTEKYEQKTSDLFHDCVNTLNSNNKVKALTHDALHVYRIPLRMIEVVEALDECHTVETSCCQLGLSVEKISTQRT